VNVAAHKRRPGLHRLERALVGVLAVEFVFLPWAFGTRDVWSQATAFALSLVAAVLALIPRDYGDEYSAARQYRLVPWPRLRRFPLFWLGGGMLVLLVVQALNPAWIYNNNGKVWWMQPIPHVAWLPSSAQTPFETFNVWRAALIYGAAWLAVCALWVGMTRRRSLQILLGVLLVNGVVLAAVGFAHRMMGEEKVLWIRSFAGTPFASFVYKNHAGAYLGLISSIGLGLAVWHYFEARKRMARSSPAPLWVLLSAFLFLAVLFSFSRGATLTLAVFLTSAVVAFLILRLAHPVPSTTPWLVNVALGLVFVAALACVVRYLDFDHLEQSFRELSVGGDASVSSRVLVRSASQDMYRDHWLLGSGAGSYRYLAVPYIKNYPAIFGRVWWDHAHIDWLEIPIELGLPGVLLIAAALGWSCWRFLHGQGWRHPVAVMLLLGCAQTMLHATIDFPFQNAAVLITWWGLLVLALRWLELDAPTGAEPAD